MVPNEDEGLCSFDKLFVVEAGFLATVAGSFLDNGAAFWHSGNEEDDAVGTLLSPDIRMLPPVHPVSDGCGIRLQHKIRK